MANGPEAPGPEGLAQALGAAAGATVDPADILWEPRGSWPRELFSGRRVVFLARTKPHAARDVYRALVRLTPAGQPLEVLQPRNITRTPVGDDAGLIGHSGRAAFATMAFDRIQGVSILEFGGVREEDRASSWLDRLMLSVTAFQRTGSFAGLGRTDIVLDLPSQFAKLRLEQQQLTIDLGEASRQLLYQTQSRKLAGPDGAEAYAARALPRVDRHKPFIFWAVDTVREEIGPAPIAWLENKVFGAKDTLRRAAYALFSGGQHAELAADAKQGTPRVADASGLKADGDQWPPAAIASLWKEPKPGEGQWRPITLPFLKPLPGVPKGSGRPPPYFYQTFIRPDRKRPYSEVQLIAMDMRQLELGMQAGYEDPAPTTGPPGDGHLPKDKQVLDRVVAVFNGAFKTTHGEYGMMVNRRVLVPPVRGAATVLIDESGKVGLGSWPQTDAIPDNIISYRQNLDPLVEDGRVNPTGRYVWGWQLEGKSVMTQRTALCVTSAGHIYYAFAEEIDGPTLAQALRQAGCSYGIHLDMNPGHCGYAFADLINPRRHQYTLRLADPAMKLSPVKLVTWSAKDFFYVMVRDPIPRDATGIQWEADPGTQPEPSQIPSIFSRTLTLGSVEVKMTSFEPGRVSWLLRAGSREPQGVDLAPLQHELGDRESKRVTAAIGLGHTTGGTGYGISFGTAPSLPLRLSYATLIVGGDHPPRIELPGQVPQVRTGEHAVQLPLIANDGQLLQAARERGAFRMRGALCVHPKGRLLLALARHDSSDVVARAVLRAGCQRVAELDRGSHHPAFIHRTETATPPMREYETSVLFALGQPMRPFASRWKHEKAIPSEKPTGFDINPRSEHDGGAESAPARGARQAVPTVPPPSAGDD